MSYMNLKNLLLESISTKRILSFHKRVLVDRKWYLVDFEVRGKFLVVNRIKPVQTKDKIFERIRKRQKLIHKVVQNNSMSADCVQVSFDKDTQTTEGAPAPTIQPLSAATRNNSTYSCRNAKVQTVDWLPEKSSNVSISSQTETQTQTQSLSGIETVNKKTQTSQKIQNAESQTELTEHLSRAVQTKKNKHQSFGCQTDWRPSSMTTQTATVELCSMPSQTDESGDQPEVFRNTLMVVIEGMGELLLNQHCMLENNTSLLTRLVDMTMLNRSVCREDIQECCKNISEKLILNQRMFTARRHGPRIKWVSRYTRHRPIFTPRNAIMTHSRSTDSCGDIAGGQHLPMLETKKSDTGDKLIQTDNLDLSHKSSQTDLDFRKPKRFHLF